MIVCIFLKFIYFRFAYTSLKVTTTIESWNCDWHFPMGHLVKALQIPPVRSSRSEQEGIHLCRHRHWMSTLSFIVKSVTRPANISTLHPFSTPTLVHYPPKMQHYHFVTRPTLSHPQEKIHFPSIRRNRLWTGREWWTWKQPLHSPISPPSVSPCPRLQASLRDPERVWVGRIYVWPTRDGNWLVVH